MSKNIIPPLISVDVENVFFFGHFSDSGSSDSEMLSKKTETKRAEVVVSSKERTVDPMIEPSNPKKRPAEVSKDKQAKKLKEGEASIPQPELPVPPTLSSAHLKLHQDVSFISSFLLHRLRLFFF